MIGQVPRAAWEAMRNSLRPGALSVARAAFRDATRSGDASDPRTHLQETLQWIYRAQDTGADHGAARSYSLRQHRRYECTGWLPSYPETTGYIIPTLYEVAHRLNDPEATTRAERMARWEAEIQLSSGAVRGGTVADEPSPAVFNTGQVLFGWVAAARETGDSLFLQAASRAARFLVDAQDPDGAWRRGASVFARKGGHVYNARAAWGLALFARHAGDADALEAARRSAGFALANQLDNGWFGDNCLTDPDQPLVHTIAYAAQGVLEIGLLTEDDRLIAAARRTAIALQEVQRSDGFLAGRFDRHWQPTVRWSCLTGCAQVALVWDRLAELEGEPSFRQSADRAVRYVMSTQDLSSEDDGVRGGVAGSFPIWGGYGPYEYLNWAAKFHLDALLGRVTGRACGTTG